MRLTVLLPTHVLVEEPVSKVVAEAENGSFALLPRHIDFVAHLLPGVLIYERANGEEVFLGTDEGTLVKCADRVMVSTPNAIPGTDLATLRDAVRDAFVHLGDRERGARSALARLEAGVVRRFLDLEEVRR